MTDQNRKYRQARVRSSSFDSENYTAQVVWTTGAKAPAINPATGEVFDESLSLEDGAVRLERLNAGAPFCNTHRSNDCVEVIGSVVPGSARIEHGRRGVCTVQFSRAKDVADIVLKVREGVVRNVSVGYWVYAYQEIDDGGESGRRHLLGVDWEPLEISAVPVPADPGSQIRSATRRAKRHPSRATCEAARRAAVVALGAQAGRPDLGREAAERGTSVQAFRDQLRKARDPVTDAILRDRAETEAAAKRFERVLGWRAGR